MIFTTVRLSSARILSVNRLDNPKRRRAIVMMSIRHFARWNARAAGPSDFRHFALTLAPKATRRRKGL